jgi:hypothetical protein
MIQGTASKSKNRQAGIDKYMVLQAFNNLYNSLEPAEKRRLNHLLLAEIRSHLKRGKDDGVIEVFIRSDGNIKRTWTEIVNQTDPGSSFRPIWLHKRPGFSNFFILNIPVNIGNMACGEKILTVDGSFVSEYLMMSDEDIRRLTRFFSIPRKLEPVKSVAKMDRHSLAIRYRELIDQEYVKNKADLAQHLGVSRVWITKVMSELKRGEAISR